VPGQDTEARPAHPAADTDSAAGMDSAAAADTRQAAADRPVRPATPGSPRQTAAMADHANSPRRPLCQRRTSPTDDHGSAATRIKPVGPANQPGRQAEIARRPRPSPRPTGAAETSTDQSGPQPRICTTVRPTVEVRKPVVVVSGESGRDSVDRIACDTGPPLHNSPVGTVTAISEWLPPWGIQQARRTPWLASTSVRSTPDKRAGSGTSTVQIREHPSRPLGNLPRPAHGSVWRGLQSARPAQ
jgi:hypothetical protein